MHFFLTICPCCSFSPPILDVHSCLASSPIVNHNPPSCSQFIFAILTRIFHPSAPILILSTCCSYLLPILIINTHCPCLLSILIVNINFTYLSFILNFYTYQYSPCILISTHCPHLPSIFIVNTPCPHSPSIPAINTF